MAVVVWIVEGTWPACVDAARSHTSGASGSSGPSGSSGSSMEGDIVLLHVTGHELPGVAHGAFAGLLGRGHPERDPGIQVEHLAEASARQLLRAAADRLGRPCRLVERSGRVEREVVAAAEDADLLILARDGDRSRLGPRSLGPAGRFVVDHAPCPVLLIWPEPAPDVADMPPPPPPPPHHR